MNPSRLPVAIAAALLLAVPNAAATTDTFTDASGDGGILSPAHDILEWTLESDGTTLTSTLEVDDLTSDDNVEYNWHFRNADGNEFSAQCTIGAGVPVYAEPGCRASLADASAGGLVGFVHSIPITVTVNLAADTVTVAFDYDDIESASGDAVTVILASSGHPLVYFPPVVGDHFLVQSPITLA